MKTRSEVLTTKGSCTKYVALCIPFLCDLPPIDRDIFYERLQSLGLGSERIELYSRKKGLKVLALRKLPRYEG